MVVLGKPMTEAKFQPLFEDLMNDYDIGVTREDTPVQIRILRKMGKLIDKRLETFDHEKELYRTKNLQNGAD